MEGVVVIGVLAIGFLLYGLPFGVTRLSSDDFFLMNRRADVKQYNDTTVAYSIQVSITIYFFFWGYQYGLSNLFFIATWFLGLLLFALAAPMLIKIAASSTSKGSLFAFLAERRKLLRLFMGVLFATSLMGLLFTELYFTAQFVESLALSAELVDAMPHMYFWLSFSVLAFVILWYCSLGGMEKVVETDTWQLSIAYCGSALFFASLSPVIAVRGGSSAFYFIYTSIPLLYLAMALMPSAMTYLVNGGGRLQLKNITFVTFSALIVSCLISAAPLVLFTPSDVSSVGEFPKPIYSMLTVPFGWAPIVGFAIINIVWQFSDYTAYHRLSLLNLPHDDAAKIQRVKESIFVTMLNSPLTWGLGIFAGMAVSASGLLPLDTTDVFGSFVKKAATEAHAGNAWFKWGLIGLAAFIGSIMMSTVDSGFMSVSQIVVRDILQAPLEKWSRVLVNVFIVVIMFAFALMLVGLNIDVLVFLNATYSWGLIFGAVAWTALYVGTVPTAVAFSSLTLGAAVGAVGTFNPLGLPFLVALVFPSVSAIVVSSAVMGIWMLFVGVGKVADW